MRMTYLGLFQKIFNWVFDKILSPIIDFLASILSSVLEWIFNNILVPVLTLVIKTVVPWILDLIRDLFSDLLYTLFTYICKIIDYIQIGFNVFIGTSDVTYYEDKVEHSTSLINALMSQSSVNKAFWIITALGLGIALILSIYATIKSTLDFDFENRRPVGTVLKSMMKCFFQFLIIPFFTLFILQLSSLVMTTINESLTKEDGPKTLGSVIFCVASLDASKVSSENLKNIKPENLATVNLLTEGERGKYYRGEKLYSEKETVKKDFNLSDFDYVTGLVAAIFLAVILLMCCITFIQRIYEILVLYIVSPLFVATMPIDDGEKFKKWKEMFIAKIFSGYGSLLAMNVYLMLCPVILGNKITWGTENTSAAASYLIKLIFFIGGAWAMLKIGPMITTMLNYQAGQSEEAGSARISGAVGGAMISAGTYVGSKVGSAVGGAFKSHREERKDIADSRFGKYDSATVKSDSSAGEKGIGGSASGASAGAFTGGAAPGGKTPGSKGGFSSGGEDAAGKDSNEKGASPERQTPESAGGSAGGEEGAAGESSEAFTGGAVPEGQTPESVGDLVGTEGADGEGGEVFTGEAAPEGQTPESAGDLAGAEGADGEGGEAFTGEAVPEGQTPGTADSSSGEEAAEENENTAAETATAAGGEQETGEESGAFTGEAAPEGQTPQNADENADAAGQKDGAADAAAKSGNAVSYGKAKKNWFDSTLQFVHRVVPRKSNKDGSYSFNILGTKIKYDKDGNRVGVKLPGIHLKYDKDGKVRVGGFSVLGVVNCKKSVGDGKFKVSSVPMIGLKRKQSTNGEFYTKQVMGIKFAHATNEETGEKSVSAVRIGNFIFGSSKVDIDVSPKEDKKE